eukprot:51389_1
MGTKVDRMFDPNHTAKAAVPRLVNAQKGRSVIKAKFKQNVPKKVFYHTSKLLLLACKSNRNNPEGARKAINAIPKHLSGDHRSCGSTWGCKSKSHKSTVKFKLIKSDSRILQKFWDQYMTDEKLESMVSGFHTNSNENWHSQVNSFLP